MDRRSDSPIQRLNHWRICNHTLCWLARNSLKKGIACFVYCTGIAPDNPGGGPEQEHATAADDFYMGVNLGWILWHDESVSSVEAARDQR